MILDLLGPVWSAALVHLWQTTLVWVALFAVARGLRRAPAGVTQTIWGLALVKLLVPVQPMADLAARFFSQSGAEPLVIPLSVQAVLEPELLAGASSGIDATGVGLLVLTILWAAGFAAGIVRLLRDMQRDAAVTVFGAGKLDSKERDRVTQALSGTPVPRKQVLFTESGGLPRVTGFLHPRIVMPTSCLHGLTVGDLRAVLLHEESHRRRRDPLRNLGLRVLTAALFFHPLAGALARRLREGAELVCDEFVLRFRIAPGSYADALARTVRLALPGEAGAAAAGLGRRNELEHRLHRLSHPGRYRMRSRYTALLTTAGLLVLASLLGSAALIGCSQEAEDVAPTAQATSTSDPANTTGDVPFGEPAGDEVAEDGADVEIGFDTAPTPVHRVPPKYPEEVRRAAEGGVVHVEVMISAKGLVTEARVVKREGSELLEATSLTAAREWRFEPAQKGGVAVDSKIVIPFQYRID